MSILESIKSLTGMIKKYNDLELNQKIIDLTQQAVELSTENARLVSENDDLKKKLDIDKKVIRYEQPYVTLDGENENIRYCSTCWAKNRTLIQVRCDDNGHFRCPECQTSGIYDKSKQRSLAFM